MNAMRHTNHRNASCTAPGLALLWVAVCLLIPAGSMHGATNTHISCTIAIVSSPDSDGDGLPDATEAWLGTDPAKTDTDGDGMPDGWEVNQGFDPLNAADGLLDTDGDGSANSHEHTAGTDPHDPASVFILSSVGTVFVSNAVVLTWNSVTNHVYDVERASNLLDIFWTKIDSNIPGHVSQQTSWTSAPPAGAGASFYRISTRGK